MAKRKMHGVKFCERLETLGTMLTEIRKKTLKSVCRRDQARADALTFALDVINDLLPTNVAYEAWGGKVLELNLHHAKDAHGKLLVYAALTDYTACEKPPHEDRLHVMRIDTELPLGTYEPRTADNKAWLDMVAGIAECGVFCVVETVREPKALLTDGSEVRHA